MKWQHVLSAGVSLALCSQSATAQTYNAAVRIDQLQPATASSPFLRAEGPTKNFDEGVAFGGRVVADYQFNPVRAKVLSEDPAVQSDGADISPVKHAALIHVGAALLPVRWLTLEFNIPFAVFEAGQADDRVRGQQLAPGTVGAGDLRLGSHFRLFNSKAFDFVLGARVWAPLGQRQAYLASSDPAQLRVELVPSIMGEVRMLRYGCTFGIAPTWFAGGDGQRLAASCAAHVAASQVISLGVEPHLAAFSFARDPNANLVAGGLDQSDIAIQFEPMGVFNLRLGRFRLALAGGAGFGGAAGTPTARGVVSLSYLKFGEVRKPQRPPADEDLDGIPDAYDACPKSAGPKDRRGCPAEVDEDGDGIIEGDACPNKAGGRYDDPKANGCPDRDNDRIADTVDPCPKQPGEGTGGCPEFAKLKEGRLVIEPKLRFIHGTSRLTDIARATLIELIRTLRANPDLGRVRLSIGARGVSSRRSQQRRKAIMALFKDKDVPDARYTVQIDRKIRQPFVEAKLRP